VLIPEIPLHNVKLLRPRILTVGFKNEVSKKLATEHTLEFAIVQDADRLDAIGKHSMSKISISILHCQSFSSNYDTEFFRIQYRNLHTLNFSFWDAN
jgi:hypothetical protein